MELAEKSDASRICPCCAEPIQVTAKVCPRCRQWMTMLSFRHPVVGSLAILLATLGMLAAVGFAMFAALERITNPGPYYTDFPDCLHVIQSRLNWVETTNGPRLYIMGTLTNRSAVAWKDVEFECRFFNGRGDMVDAYNSHGFLTIQPQDERAFRLVVIPGRVAGDYVSHKLSVSTARNTKAAF